MRKTESVVAVLLLLAGIAMAIPAVSPAIRTDVRARITTGELDALGVESPALDQGGVVPRPLVPDEYMWPMGFSDERKSGHCNVRPQSDLVYSYRVGAEVSDPWAGYIASADGFFAKGNVSTGYMQVFDNETGNLLWQQPASTSSYYMGTPVFFEQAGETWVALFHKVGTGGLASVTCWKAADGTQMWSTSLPGSSTGNVVHYAVPIFHEGYLYSMASVGTPATVWKVNALTGAVQQLADAPGWCPSGFATDGQYLYTKECNSIGRAYKMDMSTGAVVAQSPVLQYSNYDFGRVVYDQSADRLYMFGLLASLTSAKLYCIDPADMTIVWEKSLTLGQNVGAPALDEENVYVTASDFTNTSVPVRLFAYNKVTGANAWSTEYITLPYAGGYQISNYVATTAGRLYVTGGFGSPLGKVWAVDPTDGTVLQQLEYAYYLHAAAICRTYGSLITSDYSRAPMRWAVTDLMTRYNAGVRAILVPAGAVDSAQSVIPTCIVRNHGSEPIDSFDVHFQIDQGTDAVYSESTYVLGLGPGAVDTLSFAQWDVHFRDTMTTTAWTYFAADENTGDDTLSQKFLVRVRDVAVTDIYAPVDTLDSAATAYPQCQVRNNGSTAETFSVEFRIGVYLGTASVSNLNPGEARTVTAVEEYTAIPGVWLHTVSAPLIGDVRPGDNVRIDTFWVRGTPQHDVAAEAILAPSGTIDTLRVVTPTARVANYGGQPELFWAWFSVYDTATDRQMYRDSLQVSLGGGSNTAVAFRDTSFRLQGPYLARCSVDVFGDQNDLNNVVEDSFEVSALEHNVMMQQILIPSGAVDSGQTVRPTVRVRNTGKFAENFPVYFIIQGGYFASASVANLPAESSRTVEFTPWNANVARDSLFMTAWTNLAGDERRRDDTLAGQFFVNVRDVAVTQVLAPVDTLADGLVVYPQCEVRNLSTVPENFDITFGIGLYSDTANVTLSPGAVDTVTMADSIVTQPGIWLDRVQALLPGDLNLANNTMLDTFWVLGTISHDVGVAAILEPTGTTDTMTTVSPRAQVGNYGMETETWWTYFTITRLANGQIVYSQATQMTLDPGEEDVAVFPLMKFAVGGNYVARCSTFLATDQNWTNNLAAESVTVSEPSTWDPGWKEMKSVPALPSNKPVKEGAWLTLGADRTVYAAKGYKTGDFYEYDAMRNTWKQLETIPAAEAGRAKPPKKGARGVSDGGQYIYMTKGNNTLGFWRYDTERDSWSRLPDVPLGLNGKKVKGGTDAAYIVKDDTGYVYLMKGYRTEFYRFNTAAQRWDTLDNLPHGPKDKYQEGSWLCYVPRSPLPPYPFPVLYAQQSRYYDRTAPYLKHYMFAYNVEADTWFRQSVTGMPLYGLYGGRLRKKTAKDGGAAAAYGADVYALKGGNTQQFFYYAANGDTWRELDTMPQYGSTGKKKRVKNGGDIVGYGFGAFFALKGNKTYEFWRYVLPRGAGSPPVPSRGGVMAGPVAGGEWRMAVTPNPIASGFATLRYSLPKAGPVTVSVFDVAGRSVQRQVLVARLSGAASIDLRKLANGVYLVRLDAEGYSQSQKLVVQR